MIRHLTRKHALRLGIHASALLFGLALVTPAPAHCQETAENVMTASSGETAGELAKGELLITALRREKVDVDSARQAMKSIDKLFDFRLSRAGDKYVFRLSGGRKLAMLRYQRGQHVYEANWDEASGDYTARIVNVQAMPAPIHEPGPMDEDGEVDVEHAAMAEQLRNAPSAGGADRMQAEVPGDIPSGSAHSAPDAPDVAQPGDPIFPEDPALAGKPSPDAEFPDSDAGFAGDSMAPSVESGMPPDVPAIQDEDAPDAFSEQPNLLIPESNFQNEPYRDPAPQARLKRAPDPDDPSFPTISMVMFIVGLVFFLAGFFIFTVPSIRMRKRASALGLKIRDSITTAPGHCLACVEQDGCRCLISIHPDSMSFVAPCPPDDEAMWTKLKAKSYWHQMARKPLSDTQLSALLSEIRKPAQTPAPVIAGTDDPDSEPRPNDVTADFAMALEQSEQEQAEIHEDVVR